MKKIIVLFLLVMCFTINTVFAMENENYYVNDNGIRFSKEVYENFLKIGFNTSEIKTMNHNLFDSYKLMGDIQFEEKVTKYFVETSVSNYNLTKTFVEEITKEEYENERAFVNMLALPGDDSVSHETTYKKLELTSHKMSGISGRKSVNVVLTWKKVPKVISYDIIAARVTGGEIVKDTYTGSFRSIETKFGPHCEVAGEQTYTKSYNPNYNGWNIQNGLLGEKGVGLTAKLSSGGSATCQNDLGLLVSIPVGYVSDIHFQVPDGTTIYASYQHAKKSVNFDSVRRTYSFSNNGLGNVIYFSNSNLTSSYDGMAGVSLNV